MKTFKSALQILFIFSVSLCAGLFIGCGKTRNLDEPILQQAPPDQPEPPVGPREPRLDNNVRLKFATQCGGENFVAEGDEEKLSPFDLTIQPNEFSQIFPARVLKSENDLETRIVVKGNTTTAELIEKESALKLYSVSQEPFHGFFQGSLKKGDQGGWVQCKSEMAAFEGLRPTPKICKGHWNDSSLKLNNDIDFPIFEAVQDEQVVYQNINFNIKYGVGEHFIVVKFIDPSTGEVFASGLVDRYFKKATMKFFLETIQVELSCNEELNP